MPISKPRPYKKIIEKKVRDQRKKDIYDPEIIFKSPKSRVEEPVIVSKDVNRFKSKTDLERLSQIKQAIIEDSKTRFGNSTLVQIKDNIRDPLAKHVPNSLPRKSSLMGIINVYKKQGLTNFAIAVTDIKTGKVMGYTVIRLSKAAQESINVNFKKTNLETKQGEQKFRSFAEKIIPTGENAEIRYEAHLKEFLNFQIKHLTMPGYTIDPKTRDFRSKTLKERLGLKK